MGTCTQVPIIAKAIVGPLSIIQSPKLEIDAGEFSSSFNCSSWAKIVLMTYDRFLLLVTLWLMKRWWESTALFSTANQNVVSRMVPWIIPGNLRFISTNENWGRSQCLHGVKFGSDDMKQWVFGIKNLAEGARTPKAWRSCFAEISAKVHR